MDINYWIILLVLYLVYQFLRKRRSRPAPRGSESAEPERKELPDWLKELVFPGTEEEYAESEEVEVEREPERPERTQETQKLREQIRSFDVEIEQAEPREPEAVTPSKIAEMEVKPWVRSEVKSTIPDSKTKAPLRATGQEATSIFSGGRSFEDMFYKVGSLRDIIIVREVLGPPRATHPYRWRRYRE